MRAAESVATTVTTVVTPRIPDLPGLAGVDYLTSTTAMELTELPESLVVLGGGYVGLEQAQLFAHLDVPVTVVGRFAPHREPEIAAVLRECSPTTASPWSRSAGWPWPAGDRAATTGGHRPVRRHRRPGSGGGGGEDR